MRELPILFSTPMVQAIMNGTKNQTRRMAGLDKVNENSNEWELMNIFNRSDELPPFHFYNKTDGNRYCKSRYQKGDHIWVKETYYALGYWKYTGKKTKTGRPEIEFVDVTTETGDWYSYSDNAPLDCVKKIVPTNETNHAKIIFGWYKRPSLFMPKNIARVKLECTGVRCERLQDISEEDAINEGIEKLGNGYLSYTKNTTSLHTGAAAGYRSYISLWESINGKDSWLANPWVFIYDFKRIEK